MFGIIEDYLNKITEIFEQGDAREESFYPALKELLEQYCQAQNFTGVYITVLPKKTEAGNPDFRIWDGRQHITGYIEAKEPNKNLDKVEESEQLIKYLQTFPNLILTNFLEFRLYRNGQLTESVQIGSPFVLDNLKTVPPKQKGKELFQLFEKFFSFSLPKVYDAKTLAGELAKRTKFLKEIVANELKENRSQDLRGFYDAFNKYLISDLKELEFSDLFSQTITYGLFAARTRSNDGFNRNLAYSNIPQTIGILKDLFKFISFGNLPKQMEWIIDDISDVLAVTDVYRILDEYFHQHKGSDPIVHFYETFLSEYDQSTREKRGVYFTPEPVVSYIVRSVDEVLKNQFGLEGGIANRKVTVLDPAAGTLTFLAEAAKVAVEEFTAIYGEGGRSKFIKEHILENFFAFELMMAPYAIGHLKISFLLEELGYKLQYGERFKHYLTNTLEMTELEQTILPGIASLSRESHLASQVKKEMPILVIIGNPPYSGHSANVGEWIRKEIKEYYQVDGKPLKEKNPKWLQDDYVKFIRFAQWKIEQAGEGILGFITNHSYLDNPTFRGMRQSLLKTFDEIYILDLHGSSRKKERTPGGGIDENVFDIQQGVAIGIFVKTKSNKQRPKKIKKKILHSEIWGTREEKYEWLRAHNITNTEWTQLQPKPDYYLFKPRDEDLLSFYEKFSKITDIFPVNSVGIVTARDDFAVAFDRNVLERRIRQFVDKNLPDEVIKYTFNLYDTSKFKLSESRKEVMQEPNWQKHIVKLLYRPFDERWVFYHDSVVERTRKEVMQHMLMGENLGLITIRRSRSPETWRFAFISNTIISGATSISSLDINYLFPLYLYTKQEKPKKKSVKLSSWLIFEPRADYSILRKPNISGEIFEKLAVLYNEMPSPEKILYYIYAILFSNTYRTKYAEFLKIDFPRIPFARDYSVFNKIARLGERLANLHLLKDSVRPGAKFQGTGDSKVDKIEYDANTGRIYINSENYFEGIEPDVFDYFIGGYRVCEKWLKDRKNRELSLEDVQSFCKIVGVLRETIQIQSEIDNIYLLVENF